MACGIIAAIYVVYRIALVVYPITVSSQANARTLQSKAEVCAQDTVVTPEEPARIPSEAYRQRIKEQPRLTDNLITNPAISQYDLLSGQPVGYSHATSQDTDVYEVLGGPDSAKSFLRVTDTQTNPSTNRQVPSWLTSPVQSPASGTYYYSFSYRATVPVDVAVEYSTFGSPDFGYSRVVTLQPSATWKEFSSHFNDTDAITSFRIVAGEASPGQVDTANFNVRRIADAKLPAGIVTIAFDDGWQSVKSGAIDLLDGYGFKSTQYVISELAINNVAGYMNIDTLRSLKNNGHEIGSHSLRHCNQTKLSDSELWDNGGSSKQQLEQQNLGPVTSFAYPLGQYNEKTQRILTKYYPYVRTSDSGYNDKYFDETNIRSMTVLSTTTDATFKEWIQYAADNRLWVVIVYHRIDESGDYTITKQTLARQLAILKQSNLSVMSLSDVAAQARK